jgi:hypothetical protein
MVMPLTGRLTRSLSLYASVTDRDTGTQSLIRASDSDRDS